jgi:hypothetical protein
MILELALRLFEHDDIAIVPRTPAPPAPSLAVDGASRPR